MSYEPPEWVTDKANLRPHLPTRLYAQIEVGIAPVWSHTDNVGGWYAGLYIAGVPDPFSECGHVHVVEEEAWDCARAMGYILAMDMNAEGQMSFVVEEEDE